MISGGKRGNLDPDIVFFDTAPDTIVKDSPLDLSVEGRHREPNRRFILERSTKLRVAS